VDSEQKFVLGLREYLKRYKDKFPMRYILRNYPFSREVFNFNGLDFTLEFIMWIKKRAQTQTIVLIDPKD
jgi:hypothetical protein